MPDTPESTTKYGASAHDVAFGAGSVRQYPLKVIVCGLGRTGTTSIQQALGILGFPAYHAQQVWDAPAEHIAMWNRAIRAKYVPSSGEKPLTRLEWDELLGQHMAIVDVPAAWFGPELAELYPDAKVVITTRDKEAWFRSCVAAFVSRRLTSSWFARRKYRALFFWSHQMTELLRFMDIKQDDVWKFEWHEDDAKPKAMRFYDEYYDEVRERIPAEKRIEYDVQQGWDPLCAHLGVGLPTVMIDENRLEVPFPRSNDANAFVARVGKRRSSAIQLALNAWAVRIAWTAVASYMLYPHAKSLSSVAVRALAKLRTL